MEKRALVKNAADASQVKKAENRLMNGRQRELDDLKMVLSTGEGRRFYWRLLSACKTFESIWESSAKIHYNSGRQDFGHFLLAELSEADEDAYFKMVKEAKE